MDATSPEFQSSADQVGEQTGDQATAFAIAPATAGITVGRVVHYYGYDRTSGGPRGPFAAITCGVHEGAPMRADLTVCVPGQVPYPLVGVEFSEEPQADCWTWQPVQKARAAGSAT